MNPIRPQYVVDKRGKPQSVILKIREFEEIVECVEDVLDVREIERLENEPRVSWESVKAERKAKRAR